ncbi:ATP-binding protein [archaeon]|nr:ATP-binding protein [archaeon]
MHTEEVKHVITSQREEMEELFKREKIIERDIITESLKKYLSHPNILAILGVRRCGKSLFSWILLNNEKYGYINFFDERLTSLKAEELELVLQAFYELYGDLEYIIFDEIQNICGWERFVSRLRTSKKIIITGSNSQLLSGELSTFITGRHIDFELFPFNFKEYLILNNIRVEKDWMYSTRKVAEVKKMLENYIFTGGFPETYKFGKKILETIYSDIIENDILRRYGVKKPHALRELAKYTLSNFSNEITFNKLKNIINLKDVHTVSRYINYLCNAYLFFLVERFSFKLKEQFLAPKKIYCIDTGLINMLSFRASENRGRLMENLVLVELLRRKSYLFNDWEVYYWRDYQQAEVDFVIKDRLRVKHLIQVTNASGIDEIDTRQIKSLTKASKQLKCKELSIFTWDLEDTLEKDGKKIKCIPLWKWLLET